MADGVFQVAVVTPEERLVDTAARSVVLRSSDGDLTVLDGHTPLVADVVPGEVRVEPAEGEALHLAVHGGYLQVDTGPTPETAEGAVAVRTTRVTLLAGVAELPRRDRRRSGRAGTRRGPGPGGRAAGGGREDRGTGDRRGGAGGRGGRAHPGRSGAPSGRGAPRGGRLRLSEHAAGPPSRHPRCRRGPEVPGKALAQAAGPPSSPGRVQGGPAAHCETNETGTSYLVHQSSGGSRR